MLMEMAVKDAFVVSLVDDDQSVRESLPALLRQFGFHVRAFDSAESFLASHAIEETDCLILDLAMPGMSGSELMENLAHRVTTPPVIFITGQGGDICERLLASGAEACLHKPFDPMLLIEALKDAVE